MVTILLALALVVLVAGLLLSAAMNISVCAWGCSSTLEVYSLQASFIALLGLAAWVAYRLVRKKRGAAHA